jgi:hypothetical protein
LEELNVDDNKANPEAMSLLINALCKGACPSLAVLVLGHNAVGDVGLARLAAGMVSSSSTTTSSTNTHTHTPTPTSNNPLSHLHQLGLAEACVSTEGVRSLARALSLGGGRTLASLDLADNHLYPQGAGGFVFVG